MSRGSLTAPERETVILTSDADDHVEIWSAQRRIITKLKKNPSAVLVEEGNYGSTVWASFRLPANLLSFRSKRRQQNLSSSDRAHLAERLRRNTA